MQAALRVGVVQMNSHDDVAKNLERVEGHVAEAVKQGATFVLLPENFAFMGGTDEQRRDVAEALDGDGMIMGALTSMARRHAITIVGGGLPEKTSDAYRPHNCSVVVGPSGEVVAAYRKVHLFDVDVGDGQVYRESLAVTPGRELVAVCEGPFCVGLSICYDLRFPELYRGLVDLGATVLTVPAAFTMTTGKDHWHALLRARAIESQCYVVAAAQWGKHPKGRLTFGKSLVVDPWGDVVAQAEEGEGVVVATLKKGRVDAVRASLPSLSHRVIGAGATAPEGRVRRRTISGAPGGGA